jgi:hypothetical protein
MKKRIYRGVNVKKVDVERLADSVRGERVVFGLDVAHECQAIPTILGSNRLNHLTCTDVGYLT